MVRHSRRNRDLGPISKVDKDFIFKALSNTVNDHSGVANVPQSLTVNALTVSPAIRYECSALTGTDGSLAGVTGPTLSVQSTGASYTSGLTPFTGTDGAVTFAGTSTKYLGRTAEANAWDVGLNDFVITMVGTTSVTSGSTGKHRGGTIPIASTPGWGFLWGTTLGAFDMSDGTTVINVDISLSAGAWFLIQVFCDRSENSANGLRIYINGTLAASGNPSTVSGSMSDATAPTFLGRNITGPISFLSVHNQAGWFAGGATNATQWDIAAKETAAKFFGVFPQLAKGNPSPTAMTRSSIGYLDRVVNEGTSERRLFPVGNNWSRYCKRKELVGGEFFRGVLLEGQSTNLCLQSETFDNASWTKTASAVTANSLAAPTGDTTADSLIADGTSAQHYVSQAVTLTATGYILSVFAKVGNQNFIILENSTIATGLCWFNLSTGAVGTKQAGITEALIDSYGNGWYRCSIRFTGTVASHTFRISAASADNTTTFTGNSVATNTYLWGAQVELIPQDTNPSSYISTTTVSATRTTDVLQYKMNDGNFYTIAGQLGVDVMYPFSKAPTNVHAVVNVSAAESSTADCHYIRVSNSTGFGLVISNISSVGQYSITGTTNNVDGERHSLINSWQSNSAKLYVDGSQQSTTDTAVNLLSAPPAVLTVGEVSQSAYQNSLIGNIYIKKVSL